MRTIHVLIKSLNKEGHIFNFEGEEIDSKREYHVRHKPTETSTYSGSKRKGSDLEIVNKKLS
jgi:hypothetical protein